MSSPFVDKPEELFKTSIKESGIGFLAERFGIAFENKQVSKEGKSVLEHINGCMEQRYNRNVESANDALQYIINKHPNGITVDGVTVNLDYILPQEVFVSPKMKTSIVGTRFYENPLKNPNGEKPYSVNISDWFMNFKNTNPERIQNMVCHAVAHIVDNSICRQKLEKSINPFDTVEFGKREKNGCNLPGPHDKRWEEIGEKLGCDISLTKCKPAEYIDDETVLDKLTKRDGPKAVVKGKDGKKYTKWRMKCPKGCVFQVTRWNQKSEVSCKEHKEPCQMYMRKDKGPDYSEEPTLPKESSFGNTVEVSKIITDMENPDGEILTQDEETGNFVVARELIEKEECITVDEMIDDNMK